MWTHRNRKLHKASSKLIGEQKKLEIEEEFRKGFDGFLGKSRYLQKFTMVELLKKKGRLQGDVAATDSNFQAGEGRTLTRAAGRMAEEQQCAAGMTGTRSASTGFVHGDNSSGTSKRRSSGNAGRSADITIPGVKEKEEAEDGGEEAGSGR